MNRPHIGQFTCILSIQSDLWQGETMYYLSVRCRNSVGRLDVTRTQYDQLKKIIGLN